MKNKVIALKNLPQTYPVTLTIVSKLCIDYYQIAPIWQGVIWALLALIWIAVIVSLFKNEQIDLFEDNSKKA